MLTQKFRWSIPAEFNLLSTDTKPTDCPNGSRINEIDTGKVYLFDEENKVWYEKSNSGGGGGGGGSVTVDTTVNGASANPVQNKAIYDFVNSSISTNTANFIGTFNSVAELEAYSGTVTNNDYAFVISTDSSGNTVYNRYKYNGSAWGFEYALNNSSFTAAQWATIQSGLTASDKTKLDGIEAGANKTVVDANLSQTSTNPVQNKVVNDALATKQDTIADLSEIRSGAAAGATAVQQTTFETDQQRQEMEIGAVANAGAKNLLKITATSQTSRGVTFTVNDDQTVTVNGTNDGTGASTFVIVPNAQAITIPDGNYILSGCPASGEGIATAPYDLRWYSYSQGKSAYEAGAGVLVTKNGNTTDSNIAIVVKTGQTANNVVFSPMLRPASITDSTFVPYAPTNRELYETCETKITMQQAYGEATAIPDNSNLNDYTTPGLYYALVANAPTIANTPYTDTGFRLVVEKNTIAGAAVFQTLYPTSRTRLEFYRRIYEGGSWSSWYKFEGTVVS